MGSRELDENVINLKGIGEKTAKLFEKCGVRTVGDLLSYYPRCYDGYEIPVRASDVRPGQINSVKLTIIGSIIKRRVRNLSIIAFEAADQTGKIKMTYFNAPYLASSLKSGTTHIFRGMVQKKGSFYTMDQPKMYSQEEYASLVGRLMPRYPLVKGLTNNIVIKAVEQAFLNIGKLEEFVPQTILDRLSLIGYSEAARSIHFPENDKKLEEARRRLAYDEFLLFVLKLRLLKMTQEEISNSFPMVEVSETKRLLEVLPYKLTNAQSLAWKDIQNDLQGPSVMNRLIQGDVGSGKTVIAMLALLTTAANGYQGALMAPTEVLAAQHFENFKELIDKYNIQHLKPILLTGALSAKDKKEAQRLRVEFYSKIGL